jgi:hypothetical protein
VWVSRRSGAKVASPRGLAVGSVLNILGSALLGTVILVFL